MISIIRLLMICAWPLAASQPKMTHKKEKISDAEISFQNRSRLGTNADNSIFEGLGSCFFLTKRDFGAEGPRIESKAWRGEFIC